MENEKTFREVATEVSIELLEKSREMEAGTEKHSRVIEDVVKLSKACTEDYKVEFETYNENLKIENEQKRYEEEIEHKKSLMDLERLKHTRAKGDSILMAATAIGLTGFACAWEMSGGHIIPGSVKQFGSYIFKVIK